jgi:hypothetical protein
VTAEAADDPTRTTPERSTTRRSTAPQGAATKSARHRGPRARLRSPRPLPARDRAGWTFLDDASPARLRAAGRRTSRHRRPFVFPGPDRDASSTPLAGVRLPGHLHAPWAACAGTCPSRPAWWSSKPGEPPRGCSSRTARTRRRARGSAARRGRTRRVRRPGRPDGVRADGDRVAAAVHRELARLDRGARAGGAAAGEDVDEGVEVRAPRQRELAPGASVACTSVMGVYVEPGPACPPTSPAITRTSAPPSCDRSSATLPAEMSWYRGSAHLRARGRFTHSCRPWNSPRW